MIICENTKRKYYDCYRKEKISISKLDVKLLPPRPKSLGKKKKRNINLENFSQDKRKQKELNYNTRSFQNYPDKKWNNYSNNTKPWKRNKFKTYNNKNFSKKWNNKPNAHWRNDQGTNSNYTNNFGMGKKTNNKYNFKDQLIHRKTQALGLRTGNKFGGK